MLGYCLRGRTYVDLNDVMNENEASNNKALTCFNAINACINVDRVSAEDCEKSHINVIEYS